MATAQEAVTGLLEAASTPPTRNDLGQLARMHSWCQALTEAESPTASAAANEALGSVARGLTLLLERLILDEASDPETGLALVPAAARLIDQAYQGQTVNVDSLLDQLSVAAGVGPQAPCPAPPPPPAPEAATVSAQPEPAPAGQASPPGPTEASAASVDAGPPAESAPQAAGPTAEEPYVSEPLVLDLSEREYLTGFLDEATEHMEAIEAGLLELESDTSDTGKINELFRPFHTIKGIAGFLNLRDINRLTHEVETILDQGRKNELRITAGTVDLVFAGVDVLKAQLDAIRQYLAAPTGEACPQPAITEIMGQLHRAASGRQTRPDDAEDRPRLGEILVSEGVATESDVETALDVQVRESPPPRKLGEILVEAETTTRARVDRALAQQASGKPVIDQPIRVDTGKLDMLVDTVGELVIAQSMVSLSETIYSDDRLQRNVSQVTKIVRDVQETAMAMRMVQIGHTFQKMRRLVRDVARKAGKTVELTISGEDTELDKNVIQQISDPLVHLVRNAVDHGIESPEARRQAGKPEAGQMHLNAYHQGDSVVIEIRDDGQGLDPQKLIAKAIERGLIGPDEQLSDQQAFALILQAGFSTADKVTDISGRGVGLDVVKRNVEQLRGKIEIESQKGHGSGFSIRLPLTLAIIDGMLVRVGSERLIIPTILIEQSLQPEQKQITSVQRRGEMVQVRGELCPLIQLGVLFHYTGPLNPCENLVVIVQCEGQKVALVVEELIGQQQVVIKTLGERFKKVQGVSGAAILGDGRVGLILEPSGLLALHNRVGGGSCATQVEAPARDVPSEATEVLDDTVEAGLATADKSGITRPAEAVAAPA